MTRFTDGDAVPADVLLIDSDVRRSQCWGEYEEVTPSNSMTVDAAGSNRTIVVHSCPYGEEVLLPAVE